MKPIVLLVDDDVNILRGLVRALNKQPYELITAKSSEEALLILKTHDVDVIVADEMMPGMSGGELLAWSAENFPDTVRIMLTGNVSTLLAIRAINEGQVYHFFSKPCDEVFLSIIINKAIEHRKLITENRRLLAVNRRQFDELHQISKKMRSLVKVVSQDLCEPIDKVTTSCSTLTKDHAGSFEPEAKKLLDNAVEAVGEIQHIIDDLIDRAKSSVLSDFSNQTVSESPNIVESLANQTP